MLGKYDGVCGGMKLGRFLWMQSMRNHMVLQWTSGKTDDGSLCDIYDELCKGNELELFDG